MISHSDMGSTASERRRRLWQLVRDGSIALAGNRRLRIYGRLDCSSGRRMKLVNRVFFRDEAEAIAAGYRPCAHCMREHFERWHPAEHRESSHDR
ncbi:MAG: metal-binding protein ['Candidatus Kapabacteria' thiocyanatum]|uniref:Metal-binding protein n=1 Tax=Candidatus Kapaibacterium thiocyanatum TaxID=1895771 RepID=A0A1M3KZB2_9BACT|nr:metal-binding protein ['Candidatus Kapabacteria' thiocyanatum]OJX57858.1 MAG: metal-binding protein ['Candidatus Kapabacteria' thiocyanatum]